MKPKTVTIISALLFATAAVCLLYRLHSQKNNEEIQLKETATIIESARPIGILYLYSTITEDYAKDSFWGSGIGSSVLGKENGLLKRKHDCVQILNQQVNLIMDLDKIQYKVMEGSDTVLVFLPEVEFSQSTISSWFKSDNENEEGAVQYNAAPLIQRVERRIEARYNTPENRRKAEEKAKSSLSEFLRQYGKTAIFKPL
ncbi:MAG: DUF4230 domain-containing protein [Bacteroidales bacterium]|nr:DUF4230 domain-containing protein [Bacteroidales bacterium]